MANTLDDVYRKFGETAEAAQLLECELGTLLFLVKAVSEDLFVNPDRLRAFELHNKIDSFTLGTLLKELKSTPSAEAVQLLETQLGPLLSLVDAVRDNLLTNPPDRMHATSQTRSIDELEALLVNALAERNRLSHSFYRQHNFRRNSDEGRALMLKDLESIHDTLLNAYKAVMLLTLVDLDDAARSFDPLTAPTRHLPI